ncbi:MAG TPA: VOC family protein [Polyangiales bacterium]|nr:VOC family protein [Polyangiales bacterium]
MTLLSGIHHAAVMTKDLDRFVAFYSDVFGAEVVFRESVPGLRHAILRIGSGIVLHPAEVPGSPDGEGRAEMFARGHLDHLGLNAGSREALLELRLRLMAAGATDGEISDLGPQWCLWFRDPDGMRAEVCWTRDPTLRGYHAPQPLGLEALDQGARLD